MPTDSFFSASVARSWRCDPPPAGAPAFHRRLPGYAPTPLVEVPALAEELKLGRVFVKYERSRFGLPAFKALGASWAVARLVADRLGITTPELDLEILRAPASGSGLRLVTATDGNHGRAVARMAALLGLEAEVVVPDVVPSRSIEAIRAEGALVRVVATDYDGAVALAAAVAERPLSELVQDTAWPGYMQVPAWIVEGYATMLLETDAQLAEAGATAGLVAVPIGVGSLAQAVVAHYRSRGNGEQPSILGVEPDSAGCILASLRADQERTVATAGTVMAGLNCGTPSMLAWPVLRAGLDAAVLVGDEAATRAVADLGQLDLPAGPSGAATLAGVRELAVRNRFALDAATGDGSSVVLLCTEAAL